MPDGDHGEDGMTLEVIGLGVGRTGTYSLKLALQMLGLGPCHHMDAVIADKPHHVPYWEAAVAGRPNWSAAYAGFKSAVDWPTAGFTRELFAEYPRAQYVLTVRSPESWAESFSETIYKALQGRRQAPPEVQPWLEMVANVVSKTGFPPGLDIDGLKKAFNAHTETVRNTIPTDQLLIYEVKQGWEPLCRALGQKVPAEAFPRTNNREEFWERLAGNKTTH
jgi:hypothetical protein